MRNTITALVFFVASASFADEKNCKLSIRTFQNDGKTKVEVVELSAKSREDCKAQAKSREDFQKKDVAGTRVTFSFQESVQ